LLLALVRLIEGRTGLLFCGRLYFDAHVHTCILRYDQFLAPGVREFTFKCSSKTAFNVFPPG